MTEQQDRENVLRLPSVPLGDLLAERSFTLLEQSGARREVVIQLGRPVRLDPYPEFRCPFVISGLGMDGKVYAPAGGDALEAMQYSISLIGQILDSAVERLALRNPLADVRERTHPGRKHFDFPLLGSDWLWRYDQQPLTSEIDDQ